MIIAAIILGLLIIGLMVFINYLSHQSTGEFDSGFHFGIMFIVCLVIEIGIVSKIIEEPKPTSMDVYQGKTTIEYTIRDGIKVDSVVVFKEK